MSHPERPASGQAGAPVLMEQAGGTLAEFAAAHGLTQSAARPTLAQYIRSVWQRRHFVWMFATSKSMSMYTSSKLGQLWQVLTPLLNAGVYFLIFGLILKTGKGIPNFVPFLVAGVFVFSFSQKSISSGAKSVGNNLSLIRALHFPRATLPLAYAVVEFQQLLVAMLVLAAIVVGFGEPITWSWLLVVPALGLQLLFNIGLGLVVARIGAFTRDITQLIPFILRTWFYFSGIIYSVNQLEMKGELKDYPWIAGILEANPGYVYVELIRHNMLEGYSKWVSLPQPPAGVPAELEYGYGLGQPDPSASLWAWALFWAVLLLVGGFYWFYRAEERYGRG